MDFLSVVLKYVREEYGQLEEGDEIAIVLNDAVVSVSLEDATLGVRVIAGEPDRLDISTGLIAEGDNE
ncbi:hypothetical protein [Halobacillus ihumii]|uniref:hypothetical protein n=1 Tax=Halobacillus ihumii TaxID=2686092 RepID=UPI0013D57643|nr:hypothetical protein [Halobacillus ihumii]